MMRILVNVVPEDPQSQNRSDDQYQRKESSDSTKSWQRAEPFDSIEACTSILLYVTLASLPASYEAKSRQNDSTVGPHVN